MSEFMSWLAMGGYFAYVWLAYILFFVVFWFNFTLLKWQKKRVYRDVCCWLKTNAYDGKIRVRHDESSTKT